ncbi:hypothetical protein T12_7551 [Trichinella patagoniensis]|uniref:Uncharacterized protein n=1 Tax=Trichinella patagoniensis TaxID=990121 RepID=A0A0V0ZVQ8_9BILA|nr:hypothetical protein T12_7551 [Trichinella patagoniensis]
MNTASVYWLSFHAKGCMKCINYVLPKSMKQNSFSDEIREQVTKGMEYLCCDTDWVTFVAKHFQICVRLYKIGKVIFLRVSCYSRAFNIRLLLSFLTCTGAKPVELHGMHYWHILQDGKPLASSLVTIASTP